MLSNERALQLGRWLTLTTAPKLATRDMLDFLDHFGNSANIFANLDTLTQLPIHAETLNHLFNPPQALIDASLTWAQQANHHILCWEDPAYPNQLREIADPPLLLYIQGNPQVLTQAQLAIVGTRKPSYTGKEHAFSFAKDLAQQGVVITSGLAYGIDAAAHQGALSATGQTLGVMATGLQHIYPKQHLRLAEQIAAQGALVSEYPLASMAKPWHFPARNRIISGLSLGVLVVEAAAKSGSLITAQLALEQNREVFAMPGCIDNPLTKGCHALLREGAKLATCIDDILDELPIKPLFEQKENQKTVNQALLPLAPDLQKLVECVGFEPTPVDKIILRSGLTTQVVCSMLPRLALDGYISQTPAGYVRKF